MNLPKYVSFKDGSSCLRLISNKKYIRDGGLWEVNVVVINNKIFISSYRGNSLHGKELIECTKEQWKQCNGDYAPLMPDDIINEIRNIISYDDRDDDEKINQIRDLIN